MITRFEKFNEYVYYKGPGSKIGFKNSNPTMPFYLNLKMKHDDSNDEKIKAVLIAYDIPVIKYELKDERKEQILSIGFLAYSEDESESIIDNILTFFVNAGILYDRKSVRIFPLIKSKRIPPQIVYKPTFSLFGGKHEKDKEKEKEKNIRPIGFGK